MPGYYPIFLNLHGKCRLVVGGGEVAVVSPTLTDALSSMAQRGAIHHEVRPFHPDDVAGCTLVIGATDQPAVNTAVCDTARRHGIWVNIVDTPDACDFIAPAVVRRGALQIAISTGGNSPTLTKRNRKELEQRYGVEYAELLAWLGQQREHIRRQAVDPVTRKAHYEPLLDMALQDHPDPSVQRSAAGQIRTEP